MGEVLRAATSCKSAEVCDCIKSTLLEPRLDGICTCFTSRKPTNGFARVAR
ncbi:hypothetical protein NC651_038204 [Populus alba x Populus x berolinensis]|nr:hypothetical protein NC651_038204 [Populus alba x Populus x berolinensis]